MRLFEKVYLLVERRRFETVRSFILLLITLSGGTLTLLASIDELKSFAVSFSALSVGIVLYVLSLFFGTYAYYRLTKNLDVMMKELTSTEERLLPMKALELRRAIKEIEDRVAPQCPVRLAVYAQVFLFFCALTSLMLHFIGFMGGLSEATRLG